MAEPDVTDAEPKSDEPPKDKNISLWERFCTRKWLGTVIALTVVAHVTLIAYQGVRGAKIPTRHTEISLGSFSFTDQGNGGRISDAKFDLHIRLLREVDRAALIRLVRRKFKVEQDIEELLRQASGGDFDDPTLTELKRRIQERINQSLDMRAVSEVIITDLALTQHVKPVAAVEPEKREKEKAVGSADWREKTPDWQEKTPG